MDPVHDTQAAEDAGELADGDSERDEILRWRRSQILALGIGEMDAALLAETGADLGLLRRLVAQGCPPQLVVRIVL